MNDFTKDFDMPLESGAGLGALIVKFGWVKVLTVGAALAGAAMMAAFRPPKTRKELFTQGAVALGCSLLFGDTLSQLIDYWFDFINLQSSPREAVIQFVVAVHGFVGAFSWGLFGGIAVLRDKFGSDPIQVVRDVRDIGK